MSDTFYAPNGFEIINGDRILYELSGTENINTDLSVLADQEVKRRMKDYLVNQKSFVVESNLNIPSSYNIVNIAKNKKFITRLKYLGVDKLDLLNQRIAERVLRGLHNVEPSLVIQKYNDSLRILPKMINSFDDCELIDNSKEHQAGILMLSFNKGVLVFKNKKVPNWTQDILNVYARIREYDDKILKLRKQSNPE